MCKSHLSAVTVAALLATSALAADLPVRGPAIAPAPIFVSMGWSGFYIGVNAGYAWDNSSSRYTGGATVGNMIAAGVVPVSQPVKRDGVTGGAQIGYNYQVGSIVLGAEADINYTDIGRRTAFVGVNAAPIAIFGTAVTFVPGNQFTSTASMRMDWLATARLRAGVTAGNALLYVTGGAAFTDAKFAATLTRQFPVNGPVQDAWRGTTSVNSVGYAVGAGIEYAFSGNWSAKAEALYYDFGSKRQNVPQILVAIPGTTNFPVTKTVRADGVIARIGLNYRFGGPAGGAVVAKY